MTRYIYHVSVHNQDALCPDVHTVTAFINNTMGCEFVTLDMVYNYFIRPGVLMSGRGAWDYHGPS